MATTYTLEEQGSDQIYTFAELTTSDVTDAIPTLGATRLLLQCTVHSLSGPVSLQVSNDGSNWTSAQERVGSGTFIVGVQCDDANVDIWNAEPAKHARILCDADTAAVVLVVRR
jgi:hypothetical protein